MVAGHGMADGAQVDADLMRAARLQLHSEKAYGRTQPRRSDLVMRPRRTSVGPHAAATPVGLIGADGCVDRAPLSFRYADDQRHVLTDDGPPPDGVLQSLERGRCPG